MDKIKNKSFLRAILFFNIFVLSVAYFIEFVLDHEPCNLCVFERIPYLVSIILISFLIFTNKFEKIIIVVLALVFILGTIISFYHYGIEEGFFSESMLCDLRNEQFNLNKNELLKELEKKTVSCKDVTFRFFGLSLATINTMLSFIQSVIFMKMFINYEKN
tara:strand:+ start:1113 stop:1595 length:483 start_codon:yes stop_codon:yes gene_type:complete